MAITKAMPIITINLLHVELLNKFIKDNTVCVLYHKFVKFLKMTSPLSALQCVQHNSVIEP